MKARDLLIVIPAYNEEKSIPFTLSDLLSESRNWDFNFKIIVINDGSTDATSEVARRTGLQVIDLPINIGIAQVFLLANQIACKFQFEKLLILDADGQHPINEIKRLTIATKKNSVVIGERINSEYEFGFVRKIAVFILNQVFKLKSKTKINDSTSGFRMLGESAIQVISKKGKYSNFFEDTVLTLYLLHNEGVELIPTPVVMNKRMHGSASTQGLVLVWRYISVLTRLTLGRK